MTTTGGRRDDAALREGLDRFFAAHPELVPGTGPSNTARPIRSLLHAQGGLANETVLVDFDFDCDSGSGSDSEPGSGSDSGSGDEGVVVRLPPVVPTFPGYDLAPQALVQNVVASAGIPAPSPAVVIDDTGWIGSTFLVMPRVYGDIAGPAPVFDPYVRDAAPEVQRLMHDELVDTLVAVHGVPWEGRGLDQVLPGTSLRNAVDEWDAYIAWASEGDPLPALAEAMGWCAEHVPPEREPVLLWGDVRLGNLVLDAERRVVAVLDWDLARLGPREMDLGWHVGLDHMMETLFGHRVPGFPDPAEFVASYEHRSGYEVRDLGWHEVFALVRALAIHDRHQRIRREPGRAENPMATVLRDRLHAAAR